MSDLEKICEHAKKKEFMTVWYDCTKLFYCPYKIKYSSTEYYCNLEMNRERPKDEQT